MADYRSKAKLQAVPGNFDGASVTAIRQPERQSNSDDELGLIGKNAAAEIASIDGAAERNPLIVALIIRVAREIDTGEAVQLASAANTIKRLMDDLRAQCRPAAPEADAQLETPQERFWREFKAGLGA